MITERSIENVLNRVDIVDVVSRYVDLKRKGANYVACCPFHNERTPSFIVNPSRNTWHCFGSCQEGGNAIKFLMRQCNMSFPEAVRELGKMYGVTIEETDSKEQTAEQTANARKREAMIFAYEALQPFFVSQLSESSEEGCYAYSYATKRWSQDFVNECGIGYAPRNGNLLVQFAQANNIPQDVLLDMGVLRTSERNGQLYSFFRERVMIPIRDRFGRIIGYTARYIGENEETAKYLNSTSSLLYSKENSIFGIHVALRAAAKENKFYLVEGAPDVLRLHLLGVNNTIASLGSAWTEKQFSQIKRFSQNLCFLPDADPPKPGEPYGTGISAVIKNALMAIDMGFNITVKEIPLGKGNTKNDPDSFCRSKAILEDLEEEDFIIWYAKKLSVENGSQEQKSQMVMTISTLVAKIEDDVKQSMFIDMLVKTLPGRSLWKNAIRTAKKRLTEQKLKESNLSLDMIEQYGFQEQNHCYFSVGEDGKRRQWSNFTMKPLFHIKDNTMALRLYLLTNVNGVEVTVEMKQEELVSLTKFRQRVESQGNFIWKAKEEQLTTLKMYLYATTETAEQIVQLGWQQQGFFAFGNGIFTSEWHEVDELGIVRLGEQGNYYLPAFSSVYRNDTQFFQFERRFILYGVPLRVLKDDGVFTDQDTLRCGIDEYIIGNRLCLSEPVPVTETDRSERTIGHGLQKTIRTRVVLRRIDMKRMTTLDSVRTKIDDTDAVVRRSACVRIRVITIGTSHIRTIEIDIVDTVVLRTIDENHRLIDIVGTEGLVLLRIVESTTDADIVAALQYTLEGIGATSTILPNEAVRSLGNTAHAMRPAGLTDLTILDIKLIGCTGGLPRDDERRVLAMRIDDEVLRLLDSCRVDLEIIDSDTGQTQRILLVTIDPDEDKSKVLGRVSGIDTHHIRERHILPRLATANEFLAGLAERLTST